MIVIDQPAGFLLPVLGLSRLGDALSLVKGCGRVLLSKKITGGAANTFFDATSGNESILAGGGKSAVWGGAQDTVQGISGGSALIGFAGGNETFWDDGATTGRRDSISTFNQSAGDRISLNGATDTPSAVVGSATTDASGNVVVHLLDGSSITLIGITQAQLNTSYFTTH